jgi:pimeloyl-ACP methyl ester carboxylesterase
VAAYANGMRDLLSVLDIDRVTVVGHSLGGGVAAQFAYQFPERCERLVLVGSGGVGRSVSPLLRLAAIPGVEFLMPFLGLPPVRLGGRLLADTLASFNTALGRDAEEILVVFESLPNTKARRAILRTLRSGVDWRGQVITMLDRAYLAEGIPTLIIWGGRDAIIPVGHARLAHAAMPGSRLEIFEEAGHFPHHSDAQRFVEVLLDFLSSTKPAMFRPDDWRSRLRCGHRSPTDGERQMVEPSMVSITSAT